MQVGSPSLGEILIIAGRTAVVYVLLVALVRVTGKRQIGQMTPFDLVVLLLLSNAVQNAMTGPDTSVAGGVTAAVTLLVLNYLVSLIRVSSPALRWLVVGAPTTLIQDGHVQYQALQHEHMTPDDLLETLREHDCSGFEDVALATLEVDGEVSVLRRKPTDENAQKPHYVRTKRRLVRHHKK